MTPQDVPPCLSADPPASPESRREREAAQQGKRAQSDGTRGPATIAPEGNPPRKPGGHGQASGQKDALSYDERDRGLIF